MSGADGLAAFLRVLRNVAYKTTKFLFDTALNRLGAQLQCCGKGAKQPLERALGPGPFAASLDL